VKKLSKNQIAKFQQKEQRRRDGHVANNLENEGWVKDRKTGEYYDPQAAFDQLMNKPEIIEAFKRLSIR
jgi:hypothetical protein